MAETRTIFFVGKPGSGKDTQAELLAAHTGWKVATTSALLREVAASGGPLGGRLMETMNAGILTPYWLAGYVFLKALFATPESEGVIFAGTGRTLPESDIVMGALSWFGRPFVIFGLNVSDEEVKKRIVLRREKESRKDDHFIEKRLEEYYANTEKAIDAYRKAGVLTEIDGERAPEVIAAEVRSKLGLA